MAQMAGLTIAGHDTTAGSLAWMLWELAKHPEYQDKLRSEVLSTKARVIQRGDTSFTVDDLDSMNYTNAAIKVFLHRHSAACNSHTCGQETLRFHPIGYNLHRMADCDDVIPLEIPIISKTGEVITELPVKKGQPFIISLCGYNRLVTFLLSSMS